MKIRISEAIAAGLGIIVADWFMVHVAPKMFDFMRLQVAGAKPCCAECQAGSACKNVTDRAQVIDLQPVNGADHYAM